MYNPKRQGRHLRRASHSERTTERAGKAVEWACLPGNVVDALLVHIPKRQTPCLRLVCRQWQRHVDQGIRTMVTNPRFQQLVPVSKIPGRFPMVSYLDLSCQLSSLEQLHHLRTMKLTNWSTLPLNGFQAVIGMKSLGELDITNCSSVGDNYLGCFRFVQSNLRVLILSGCSKITDLGVSHLSLLPYLIELRLARVGGVTGKTLVQLPSSLESLDLSFCESLSDGALQSLLLSDAFTTSLTYLNIEGCQNVKSRTLSSLSALSCMSRLKLSYLAQPLEIGQWRRMTELCVLDVSYASGLNMQEALPVIGEMAQLRSLRMNGCRRTQGLQARQLAQLKKLRCLELSQWSNIQFGLDAADLLPNLEVLDLSRCYGPINNAQPYFKNSPKLKILGLSQISFLPLNVLKGVGRLSSLEVLNLSGLGNMSNRTIQELSQATSLKYLDLSQNGIFCKVTNIGALSLKCLRSLKSLKISGWTEVTPNGFSVLQSFSELTSLNVSSCSKVTNKVVKGIAESLTQLTELSLVNCFQVTCSGLGILRKLRELDTLKLSIHLKGDIDSQLPNMKDLQLISPLNAELWDDRSHPSTFQNVLEKYSREEDGTGCDRPSTILRV